jgi:hypothetical protein
MATLALENGAVHTTSWSSPNGSAMLSEPRWFYDEPSKTFVMTFIRVNATNYFAQTGIGTVRMKLIETDQTLFDVTGQPVDVKYKGAITNNYNLAWRNYFNNPSLKMQPVDVASNSESLYKLDDNVHTLVIKQYNVTVLSL